MSQKEVVTTRSSRKSSDAQTPKDPPSKDPSIRVRSERHERARTESPRPGTPLAKIATPQPKFTSPKKELDARRTRRSRGWNVPKESAAAIFRATSVDKNPAPPKVKKRPSVEESDEEESSDPPLKRLRASKNGNTINSQDMEQDCYCWLCHREGKDMACCELCPRVYHVRCLPNEKRPGPDWMCPECETIMRAECTDTRSRAMTMLSLDHLCALLKFALLRMKHMGSEPFQSEVDPASVPNYDDYVVHPMHLEALEKNINNKMYGCTDAFLAESKWLLHNCIVYNGTHHKLTTAAKMIVKICKHEMNEIEICPDCYSNSQCKGNPDWFCLPCRYPHPLVWAKLKGYPFWPAKALRKADNQVDVRFFGAHDRSWLPVSQIFLLSKDIPVPVKNKRGGLENSINETDRHIKLLKEKFGHFEYAPFRTPYDREDIYCPIKLTPEKPAEKTKIRKKRSRQEEQYGTGFEESSSGLSVDPLYRKPRRLQKFQSDTSRPISASSKTASALKSKYSSIINTRRGGPRGGATITGVRSRSHAGLKSPSGVFVTKETEGLAKVASEAKEEASEPTDPQAHFFKTLQLKKGPEKRDKSENPVNGLHTDHDENSNGSSSSFTKMKDTCDKMAVLKIPRLDMTKAVKQMVDERRNSRNSCDGDKKEEIGDKEMDVESAPAVKRTTTPPTTLTPPPETDAPSVKPSIVVSPQPSPASSIVVSPQPSPAGISFFLSQNASRKKIVKQKSSGEAKRTEQYSPTLPDYSTSPQKCVSANATNLEAKSSDDTTDAEVSSPDKLVGESEMPMAVDSDESIKEEESKQVEEKMECDSELQKDDTATAKDSKTDDISKTEPVESSKPSRGEESKLPGLPVLTAKPTTSLEVPRARKGVLHGQLQKTIQSCRKNLGMADTSVLTTEDEDKLVSQVDDGRHKDGKKLITQVESFQEMTCEKASVLDQSVDIIRLESEEVKMASSVGDTDVQIIDKELKNEMMEASEKMEAESIEMENQAVKIPAESKSCESLKKLLSSTFMPEARSASVPADAREHGNGFRELADRIIGVGNHRATSEPPSGVCESPVDEAFKVVDVTGRGDPGIKNILAKVKQLSDQNVVSCKTVVPPVQKGANITDASRKRKPKVQKVILAKLVDLGATHDASRQTGLRTSVERSEEERDSSDAEKLVIDLEEGRSRGKKTGTWGKKAAPRVVERSSSVSSRTSEPMDVAPIEITIPLPIPRLSLPPPLIRPGRGPFNFGKYSQQMLQSIQGTFQELYEDIVDHEESMVTAKKYQQELENLKWAHRQHLGELKHNFELAMKEVTTNLNQDRTKAIAETRKTCDAEHKKLLDEVKKKQWCALCGKEAIFYCCWNTSYCDFPCQQSHWPDHMGSCTQAQTGANAPPNAEAPPTPVMTPSEGLSVVDGPSPSPVPAQVPAPILGQAQVQVPVPPPNIQKQVVQPGHVQLPPSSQVMYFPVSAPPGGQNMQAAPRPPHMTTMTAAMPHIQMQNMNAQPQVQQRLPGQMLLQQQRPLQPGQMIHSVMPGQPPNFGNRMMPPMQQTLHGQPQPQMPVYVLNQGFGMRPPQPLMPQFQQRPFMN